MNLADEKLLYRTLPNLELYNFHIAGKTYTKEAHNLPFLFWPDGTPCTPANMYMLILRDTPNGRGGILSRRGKKGGTLGDYANKISQLIRFCYRERKNFLDLNDADFSRFMSEIITQRLKNHVKQRQKSSKTANLTGQVCLRFLQYLGNFANQPNFVAPRGIINISYRISTRIGRNEQVFKVESMHHHSFAIGGDAPNTRDPISDESIKTLKDTIDKSNVSPFLKQRKHLHIQFLEYLGPRVGELSELTISAVNNAFALEKPMLELSTLKKGVKTTRLIPVSRMLLQQARKHIKTRREKIISKFTKSGRPDHDFVFISETTGKPLGDSTITNEINSLARAANIEAKACPHMFRHAFCTNLFVLLFERHKFQSEKHFEIRLISDESFLNEVMQYTGHSDQGVLKTYIKRAYRRLNKIPETISMVELFMHYQEFEEHLNALSSRLGTELSIDEYKKELSDLMQAKKEDLATIQKRSRDSE